MVEQKRREFHTIGMVLGYPYSGSPVIAGDDDLPPPLAEDYAPVAVPGALAPHLWLAPGVSLYDRFGTGFTLLDRSGGSADAAAVGSACIAERRGLDAIAGVEPVPYPAFGERVRIGAFDDAGTSVFGILDHRIARR